MLLGTTAAISKTNFIDWVDNLISSVATEECKAYTVTGVRQSGLFTGLSSRELMKVMAKLSNLKKWTQDIMANFDMLEK